MTDLNDAVVLITGASGGFGRQMTRQFLQAGSRVLLTDIDEASLDSLTAEFQTESGQILGSIAADLVDDSGCRKLFDDVQALKRSPDILINNAGIGVGGRFDHVPSHRWEQVLQINLLAPMRICYLFLPQMIERGQRAHCQYFLTGGLDRHVRNFVLLRRQVWPARIQRCTGLGTTGDIGIKISTVYPFFSRTPILDSEQFGFETRREVPDDMVTDPADVVAEIVDGVRKNRSDIFPDKMSHRIHYLKRFLPWSIPLINRRLQERTMQDA